MGFWMCVGVGVAATVGAGCAKSARGPKAPVVQGSADGTVRAWISAIEGDHPQAAYALLAPELQQRTTYAEFAARWNDARPELRDQAKKLRARLGAAPPGEQARIRYADGGQVALARSGAGWRMERPFAAGAVATTPWEAVLQFADAMATRNFHKTMRLVVGPLRERIERELDDHVEALQRAKPGDLQKLSATRYRLRFGDYWLELQRDKGTWKIAHME